MSLITNDDRFSIQMLANSADQQIIQHRIHAQILGDLIRNFEHQAVACHIILLAGSFLVLRYVPAGKRVSLIDDTRTKEENRCDYTKLFKL